jgi:hypothetical protein
MRTPTLLLLATATASWAAEPSITIYNGDYAVVREKLALDLKTGINQVTFAGATADLDPDSVILRDTAGKIDFKILEQSYRNDPVTEELLLSMFEGKTLEFEEKSDNTPSSIVSGKVIRSGYVLGYQDRIDPIIEVNGKLMFRLPGRPLFPALVDSNILKPTLSWKLASPQTDKVSAEVAYLSGGFTWQASYNIVASEKSDTVDLVGWVAMDNYSGMTFTDAKIKLMAGTVYRTPRQSRITASRRSSWSSGAGGGAAQHEYGVPVVREKSFDEFHLYTLASPTTLRDKETKQVEFVRANGIQSTRRYVFDSQVNVVKPDKIQVWRSFRNSEANKLGFALPEGTVRFYAQDDDGQKEFVGENKIEHTSKDELVTVRTGNSFDLIGERRFVETFRDEEKRQAKMTVEVKLRNRKAEAATINVIERVERAERVNWKLLAQSQPLENKYADRFEFKLTLAPGEEKTVTYTIQTTW